jgi:hypothetical protein
VRLNGTLVEDTMRRFKGECAQLSFNKGLIRTHDGASAKFSTNLHETDNMQCRTYQRDSHFYSCCMLGFNTFISIFTRIRFFLNFFLFTTIYGITMRDGDAII